MYGMTDALQDTERERDLYRDRAERLERLVGELADGMNEVGEALNTTMLDDLIKKARGWN